VILDDVSTGLLENVASLLRTRRVEFVEGSVLDEDLVLELLEGVDVCIHLAAVVGVNLVVEQPVETLLRNVRGADTVLSAAAALRKRLLFASTSEVYGKVDGDAVAEDCDRVVGPTTKARWNYATSKAFGEALALSYYREVGAENIVVRLFNTVGPRQTGKYGMVMPRFVRQAVSGENVTVYGDGTQSRCFAHVFDTVEAIMRLLETDAAIGCVVNVGRDSAISILDLAKRVIKRAGSHSRIEFVPYEEAYLDGFEELGRRTPNTELLGALTGWLPTRTIEEMIDDMVLYERTGVVPAVMNGSVHVG
jgi:UDP-glucose 4-epimerase